MSTKTPSQSRTARSRRQRCLEWIMAHRPRRLWLVTLEQTPAFVERQLVALAQAWRNGDLPTYAAQLMVMGMLSCPIGAVFALAF